MKKIIYILMSSLLLVLVGCQSQITDDVISIEINVPATFDYYIGDEIIDYQAYIEVETSSDSSLVVDVIIDDLGVNYMLVGTYPVHFSLIYQGILYQTSAMVNVKVKQVDVFLIFEIPESFIYTVGDDLPNYLENVVAKDSNDLDLLDYVTVDDAMVNYELAGEYTIYFELHYESLEGYEVGQVVVIEPNIFENITFNIYYLNDLHGAILNIDNQMGLSRIGHLILDEKEKSNETTLFISGGDMLQGQLISNYYDGASTIELLNDMQLDAFVVGNHEFDWGIETVTGYFDGTYNLQANFPFLGANVYEKASNSLASGFEPYTIIEKSGVKIAVIGTMGYGLESSIAYARIQNHKFVDPIERTGYYAQKARVEDGADIVLAVNHADSSTYNEAVAHFSGDKKVDAIFNGHTHWNYTRTINQTPIIQSGANGSYVGKVSLDYNKADGVYSYASINLNESDDVRLQIPHDALQTKIDQFYFEISGLYEPIMIAGQSVSRSQLTTYIAKLMQVRYQADVGLHNSGGTRADIANGEALSYAKLHAISPFDNSVVLVEITGSELLDIIGSENAYYRQGLSKNSIVSSQVYTLALNDYIFGSHQTIREKDATFTGVTVLDLFVEVLEQQSETNTLWYADLPVVFANNLSLFTHLYTFNPQISI